MCRMNVIAKAALAAKPKQPVTTAVKYFGKYRGTVVRNVDPMMQGRLVAVVADVGGVAPLPWATACVPFISGTLWVPPPVGAGVWIEFEQGNPGMPIWTGCYSLPPGQTLFAEPKS